MNLPYKIFWSEDTMQNYNIYFYIRYIFVLIQSVSWLLSVDCGIELCAHPQPPNGRDFALGQATTKTHVLYPGIYTVRSFPFVSYL